MASRGTLTGRALLLTGVITLVMVTIAMPTRTWFAQRAEVVGLRAKVEQARSEVADLRAQRARWDDPAFVTAEARRRLHMALPGETPYLTVGEGPLDPPPATTTVVNESWLDRLLADVRRVDDGTDVPASVDMGAEPAAGTVDPTAGALDATN